MNSEIKQATQESYTQKAQIAKIMLQNFGYSIVRLIEFELIHDGSQPQAKTTAIN